MNLRGKLPSALATIWIVVGALIYFRQFAAPGLLYLSRIMGRH
jgi:hypothetical protein